MVDFDNFGVRDVEFGDGSEDFFGDLSSSFVFGEGIWVI